MSTIVQRLSKFTRTDVSFVISGLSWLGASAVVLQLLGLAQFVAFTNFLPPETYGTFLYVLSIYGLASIATMHGLSTAVKRSVARGLEGALRTAVRQRLVWGILASTATFGFGAYYYLTGNQSLALALVIVGVALPFAEAFGLYLSFTTGRQLFKEQSICAVAEGAVTLLVTLAALFLTDSLLWVVLAYYLSSMIPKAVCYAVVVKRHVSNRQQDPEMWRYGRSLSVLQALTAIQVQADNFLLFHFLGPANVAVFSVALAIPRRFKGLLRVVSDLAFARLATRNARDVGMTLPRKLAFETVGVLGLVGMYILAAPYLFELVFPQYSNSVLFTQVLAFTALTGISYPVGAFLEGHGFTHALYVLHLGTFLVKILTMVVFIPLMGIWGAVISVLCATSANVGISMYYLLQHRWARPQPVLDGPSLEMGEAL